MKAVSAAIPILTVLVGGLWIGWQYRQINSLREQNEELSQRLDRTAERSGSSTKNRRTRTSPLDTRPINWLLVADEFQSGTVTSGFYRSTFGLDEQLRRLSARELKKGLRDIESGNWDPDRREGMVHRILKILLGKDPGYLLLARPEDPELIAPWNDLRQAALGAWAKISPREATRWFDSQATDSLTPRERQRLRSGLLGSLMVSDFPLALERFEALPESDQMKLVRSFNFLGSSWNKTDFANHNLTYRFAELTRRFPERHLEELSSPLTWLGDQDRPAVISAIQQNLEGWDRREPGNLSMEVFRDYLSKVKPSSPELNHCIDTVIEAKCLHLPDQPKRDPEGLRAWLQSELQTTVRPK